MPLSLHNNEISADIKYVWLLANPVQYLHIFPCIIIVSQIHQIVQKVDFFLLSASYLLHSHYDCRRYEQIHRKFANVSQAPSHQISSHVTNRYLSTVLDPYLHLGSQPGHLNCYDVTKMNRINDNLCDRVSLCEC